MQASALGASLLFIDILLAVVGRGPVLSLTFGEIV